MLRIGIISPYHSVDGIAEYSRLLYAPLLTTDSESQVFFLASRDYSQINNWEENNVVRCWDRGGNDYSELVQTIIRLELQLVHLQLHESFMQLQTTADLIKKLHSLGVKVFVTPHVVQAPSYDLARIASELRLCEQIFVHNSQDVEHLQTAGLANVQHFPHPLWEKTDVAQQEVRQQLELNDYYPIVATHGLIAPNKGLLETLESIVHLRTRYPQVLWLAVNAVNKSNPASVAIHTKLKERIRTYQLANNVLLVDDFLQEDEEIITLLSAADIGLLAYDDWGESASGAARKFIAAQVPTVATNIKQLIELQNAFYLIQSNHPVDVVAAINDLLAHSNKALVKTMLEQGELLRSKYNWEVMAEKLRQAYLAAVS